MSYGQYAGGAGANANYPPPAAPYPPPGGAPYPQPGTAASGHPPYEQQGNAAVYPPAPTGFYPPPPQSSFPAAPVVVQPPAPLTAGGMPGVPPGLEYLTMVDQLIIKQKVELAEVLVGFETSNKYTIMNSLGQKVFMATEQSNCCTRQICGSVRNFDMKIKDTQGNEVIHLYRPLRCQSCCWPCCLQKMEIESPPGNTIGYVYQEWSILFPRFTVRDPQENVIFRIEGPFCTANICGEIEFQVVSAQTGHNVGKISKQWSGLAREFFTDSDNFGISFPLDLHVQVKALLLGAMILIDFMYFEHSQ